MTKTTTPLSESQVKAWLGDVKDPEIPVISIADLGVLYDVTVDNNEVLVTILPTYSGCPAMDTMQEDIVEHLKQQGVDQVRVVVKNTPAWTTDRITKQGRRQLQAYGIAPPLEKSGQPISCPQCGSTNTTCISQFGSTACKALYRCEDCLEPFDYFKCHV
ncbi:1,2-phenylacetyl-CoA epoxidase subunit PaaD [Marinicella gelatinilytica]|uniref:1,2-phenylacetyl-CoA epoxidase subunit PaaD n=1 Tax=Marinicella gelatinilytica TaxID=2996017 RepID=UPI0022610029|nr:1,2-phenylacetyl-CoA epoxidase subunit PaaD [Marinicella gelatinilytica]MCX7543774.1 phenylacetate-CoA oxygenase subunit PaaJ [Marinicella gelatinilytica]